MSFVQEDNPNALNKLENKEQPVSIACKASNGKVNTGVYHYLS